MRESSSRRSVGSDAAASRNCGAVADLVEQSPDDDAGMVAIAADQLRHGSVPSAANCGESCIGHDANDSS